ncbi:MAG: OmpA family protein [Peptococcaceae bacterium]|nr:OmpA family protein [Peptococcaceae bacterium]
MRSHNNRIQQHGEDRKPNHERWLITYADLITLLLIFFVVLYSFSKIDAEKFAAIAESLTKALGGGQMSFILDQPGTSIAPGLQNQSNDIDLQQSAEAVQLARIEGQLRKFIKEKGLDASISVISEERGVVLSIQDTVLFESGKARLTPEAKEIIDEVGLLLLSVPNYIRIEGHTDNLPIHTREFPSNWELSVARACSVVQRLIKKHNFPPERLSATGYGEYRPRVPNDTAEHRQINRRVDFVILSSKYIKTEPKPLFELSE